MENLEPILKTIFEENPLASADHARPKPQTDSTRHGQNDRNSDSDGCQSTALNSIKTKVRVLRMVILCLLFGSTSDMTGFDCLSSQSRGKETILSDVG